MKIKIKCYVKEVKTSKSTFITRFTFIPSFDSENNKKEDVLCSVKFTKDVPDDMIPEVSSTLICEDKNVSLNHNLNQVWITKILDVSPMERPVEDLSQYFETVDEPENS